MTAVFIQRNPYIHKGVFMNPTISTTIERNSHADTVESDRVMHCIEAAVSGAWQAYFKLGKEGCWLDSILMTFRLANDGRIPTGLVVDLSIKDPVSEWVDKKKFLLNQFSTKEPAFLQASVRDTILSNLRELLRLRYEALQREVNRLDTTRQNLSR
jgi:hypothetical protein